MEKALRMPLCCSLGDGKWSHLELPPLLSDSPTPRLGHDLTESQGLIGRRTTCQLGHKVGHTKLTKIHAYMIHLPPHPHLTARGFLPPPPAAYVSCLSLSNWKNSRTQQQTLKIWKKSHKFKYYLSQKFYLCIITI